MSAAEQSQAAGAATTTTQDDGAAWLQTALQATRPRTDQELSRNRNYLEEYVRQLVKPGMVVSKDAEQNIKYWIKEIDKKEVKNMLDFGRHIKKAMHECNFTVGTYEPADPGGSAESATIFESVGLRLTEQSHNEAHNRVSDGNPVVLWFSPSPGVESRPRYAPGLQRPQRDAA